MYGGTHADPSNLSASNFQHGLTQNPVNLLNIRQYNLTFDKTEIHTIMKIPLLLLAAPGAFVEALCFHQNGTASPNKHDSVLDNNPKGVALADISSITNPVKVLQSKECALLLENMITYMNGILEFTDEETIEFAYNSTERKSQRRDWFPRHMIG